MRTNSSGRRAKLMMGVLILGVAFTAAACFTQPSPPKSTTTTTHPASTTTTTLAATTTTTQAATTTTTTVPLASCTAGQAAIAPNPVVEAGQFTNVDLCYNSAAAFANKRLFITECNEDPATAGFSEGSNCSGFSEALVNPGDNTTGVGHLSFSVFYGKEPSGDLRWGCYKTADTPPANITKVTTCFIRVTDDAETNNTDQLSIPFTFAP